MSALSKLLNFTAYLNNYLPINKRYTQGRIKNAAAFVQKSLSEFCIRFNSAYLKNSEEILDVIL